jgi:hypothetical protein
MLGRAKMEKIDARVTTKEHTDVYYPYGMWNGGTELDFTPTPGRPGWYDTNANNYHYHESWIEFNAHKETKQECDNCDNGKTRYFVPCFDCIALDSGEKTEWKQIVEDETKRKFTELDLKLFALYYYANERTQSDVSKSLAAWQEQYSALLRLEAAQ